MDLLRQIFQLANLATEGTRATIELGLLKLTWPDIQKFIPKGDGHPVLVLPGFMAHDVTTIILRNHLRDMGYGPYGWENGQNLGLNLKTAAHLKQHLENISTQHDNARVSIIGHSLGGVFARELAREHPHLVRSVITLGSPFGTTADNNTTPQTLRALYNILNPDTAHITEDIMGGRALTPPPVPTTSILSRRDGVVHWSASLNPATEKSENILIPSSHVGMGMNPIALGIIMNRLAQTDGEWKPYDNGHLPWYARSLMPTRIKDDQLPPHPHFNTGQRSQPLFV
jgi:pimeloyl-ACP methyl ester carboxylesterase